MRTCGALLAVLPLLAVGCVTMETVWPGVCGDKPPCGAVHQVVVTWNNEVMHAADPTHNGALVPGIGGRLFLFGPQIDFPLTGDGAVIVDLFDETNGPAPVQLERWTFDPPTLKRLLRKDMIGWGYTIFLPWSTYKPEITAVRLKLCYQPKNGSPLYAESAAMTLNDKDANFKGAPLAKKPGTAPVTPASGTKTPAKDAVKPVGATKPEGSPQPGKS